MENLIWEKLDFLPWMDIFWISASAVSGGDDLSQPGPSLVTWRWT